jgi:hypothetical protein
MLEAKERMKKWVNEEVNKSYLKSAPERLEAWWNSEEHCHGAQKIFPRKHSRLGYILAVENSGNKKQAYGRAFRKEMGGPKMHKIVQYRR